MIKIILKGGPCDGVVEPTVLANSSVYVAPPSCPGGRYLATGEIDEEGRRVFGFSPPLALVGSRMADASDDQAASDSP